MHGAGSRWRGSRAPHGTQPPDPRRGALRRPAVLPGQGEAGHEARDPAGALPHPEMDLPGALQPQRRHVHQGADPRAARRRGSAVSGRRLHPDRMSALRRAVPRIRGGGRVPGRLGPLRHVEVPLAGRGRRRGREGLLDGQLSGREGSHHAERPDRVASAPSARCSPGEDDFVAVQPAGRRRGDDLRSLRRVLREGDRQRDGLRGRRRRNGPDAVPHLRPVPSSRDRPEGHLLVRRPQPARGVLPGRLRSDRRRKPQLRVEAGPLGAPARRRLVRLHRVHPPGALRQLPEGSSQPRGRRVLPLRSAAHAQGLPPDA